jgi:hypothetical protein
VPEKSRHELRTPHCGDLYPMLVALAGENTGGGPRDIYGSSRSWGFLILWVKREVYIERYNVRRWN